MSFNRRNPDDPVPKPWNWWFLGSSIVCGVAALVVAFVFTEILNEPPPTDGSSVITTTVYVLMILFIVLLAACLGLGYTAVHRRIRDPEDD